MRSGTAGEGHHIFRYPTTKGRGEPCKTASPPRPRSCEGCEAMPGDRIVGAHSWRGHDLAAPDTTTVVNRADRARDRNRPNRNAACEGRPGAAGCEYVASLQARSRNVLRRGPVSHIGAQKRVKAKGARKSWSGSRNRSWSSGSASVFRSKAANARALDVGSVFHPTWQNLQAKRWTRKFRAMQEIIIRDSSGIRDDGSSCDGGRDLPKHRNHLPVTPRPRNASLRLP